MAKFDEQDYHKKKLLEALANRQVDPVENSANFARGMKDLRQSDVPKLSNPELYKDSGAGMVIKGGIADVPNNEAQKLISGKEFAKKQNIRSSIKQFAQSAEEASRLGDEAGKARSLKAMNEVLVDAKKYGMDDVFSEAIKDTGTLRKSGLANIAKRGGKVAKTFAKKGLKQVPIIGPIVGAISALSSGDAAAATGEMLVPGGLEDIGPAKGSLERKLESGERLSPEEREILLRKQALQNKLER